MKIRYTLVALMIIGMLSACGNNALTEKSRIWLVKYELFVDEYIDYFVSHPEMTNSNPELPLSLEEKLMTLSWEAEEIRKDLKPAQAIYFFKEFGRITSKMSPGKVIKPESGGETQSQE